ncbi:radical SAM protein [Candidatus Dependentiae bacterium]|nr:radical SAM protein [Candidatus Dependentiae bacterium]
MKILFINYPAENVIESEVYQSINIAAGKFLPLGLLSVAAFLKKNIHEIDIKITDCLIDDINYSGLEKIISEYSPDVIGLPTYLHTLPDLKITLKLIRKLLPYCFICLGGANTRNYAEEMLSYPEVNAVITGDGEKPFFNLISNLKNQTPLENIEGLLFKDNTGKIIRNQKSVTEFNIDDYPEIDRNILNYRKCYSSLSPSKKFTTVISSRGCPYNCKFCIVTEKKYRVRNINNIINELHNLKKLGIDSFMFNDDAFNCDYERTLNLVNSIKKNFENSFKWSCRARVNNLDFKLLKSMKDSGCYLLQLGIETCTDDGLKDMNKKITFKNIKETMHCCRQLKIKTLGYFMFGLPFEKSKQQIKDSINKSLTLGCDYAFYNVYTPYPFSEYFDLGVTKGICSYENWKKFVLNPSAYFEIKVWDEYLSKKELFELLNYAYLKFYLRPNIAFKVLSNIKSFSELTKLFKMLISMLFK